MIQKGPLVVFLQHWDAYEKFSFPWEYKFLVAKMRFARLKGPFRVILGRAIFMEGSFFPSRGLFQLQNWLFNSKFPADFSALNVIEIVLSEMI